jgi:hypothetical protein
MNEQLEGQPGLGFWLCIEQKNAREIMVEVSEKCWRRHRMLGSGSPYTPGPSAAGCTPLYLDQAFETIGS